jgi:hypothetical protein
MTARRRTPPTRLPPPGRASPAGRVQAPAALAAAFLGLGACTFEPSAASGPGDGSEADGGADPADGSPIECPEQLHTEFSVGGVVAPGGGAPLVTVQLGDTVRLNASGSCSRRGQVSYEWTISDGGLASTASPGLDRESLTVFPALPGDYTITLTVSDDVESDESVSVLGIRAVGWAQIAQDLEVRDVAVGSGRVWIASNLGPRFIDLLSPGTGPQDVNAVATGDTVPDNLGAVHQTPGSNFVWFGRRTQDGAVWRLDVSELDIDRIPLPTPPDQTEVRDISAQGAGVAVATREGVTVAADNLTFGAPIAIGNAAAVTENPEGGWAGDAQLFRLSDRAQFSPFGESNNRIVALAGDARRIWVGSDDNGVARFDSASRQADVFTESDGLPSNRVRALAVDSSSDVWAATQDGVARYKRDRGVWVSMGEDAGLGDLTDLRAVAVLEGDGQRLVVVGANDGVAVLGL